MASPIHSGAKRQTTTNAWEKRWKEYWENFTDLHVHLVREGTVVEEEAGFACRIN